MLTYTPNYTLTKTDNPKFNILTEKKIVEVENTAELTRLRSELSSLRV